MGDRWFDLGNFAVNNELGDEDEERLLTAYFGERPDARQAPRSSCSATCRTCARRCGASSSAISELDFDFEGYAAKHFARLTGTGSDPASRPGSGTPGVERPPRAAGRRALRRDRGRGRRDVDARTTSAGSAGTTSYSSSATS